MTPDNIQLFCKKILHDIRGKLRFVMDQPRLVTGVGCVHDAHQIHDPFLEMIWHGRELAPILPRASDHMTQRVFSGPQKVHKVFSIPVTLHTLKYTHKAVRGNISAHSRIMILIAAMSRVIFGA